MQHCLKTLSAGLIAACAVLSASAEKVLYFDGSTYINTTKFTALTGNLSMSAWIRVSPNIFTVNPHNTSGTAYYGAGIIGQGYYGGETGFGLLANSGANTPSDTSNDGIAWQVRVKDNASAANKNFASGTYYGEGGTLFTGDEWHHYLVVRDTATAKARFYVDGSLVKEADFLSTLSLSPTRNFCIGRNFADSDAPGGCFVGYIADVALWNVALGDADAAKLPAVGPQKVSTAPYAYFPLDEGSGTYVSNVVANVGYAKTAGTLTWQEDASFVRSQNFVVAGEPVACGIPSPSYGNHDDIGAGDSFTVSCGATPVADAAGTAQYSCTGWKLYDWTNAVVSTGAGTSFTYVHPTPAEYRKLEWQWEETAYHGTIAAGYGGAVPQSSTGWFAAGTPVTVTATPNAGNGFKCWTGTLPEGISATSASVTFTPTAPFSMTAVFETVGSGGLVFFNEKTSSYWHTATNCVIDLPIEFPAGASSATLSVAGIDYSAQYAIPSGTAQYTLSLPAATSSTAENVYDLALAFNDSASTVRTAKLGLIYGHDATTTGWTRCLAPAGTRAWSKTKGVAVIPIPYGTTSFTIALDGGEATSTDTGLDGAAGWYPLRLKGETTADLAATTLEGSLSANLRGDGAGFFLIVR